MSTFWCLLKREVRVCFLSPIAFVVMFFFWMLSGGNFCWLLLNLAHGEPLMMGSQMLFGGVLSMSLPVIVPLITMRLFAEERKLGTLESLLTTSVRVPELVLAKFFGALVFYAVLWAPVLVYAGIQRHLSPSEGIPFPDAGALFAGALGIMLVGSLFVAVGVLMSSLTANQIVAAISGFAVLCGGFFVMMYLAFTAQDPLLKLLGQSFSTYAHLLEFARGTVDSRVVVLYLSYTVFFLFAAVKVVESKRV
jgi:ABC-2 type transport system permease protein